MVRDGLIKIFLKLRNRVSARPIVLKNSYQIENFAGLSSYYFGTTSLLTNSLLTLYASVKLRVTAFEAIQCRDQRFATSFGYGVDTRTYRWLQQCRDATDRESIDDTLINFAPMVTQVLLDNFIQPLPDSLALIEKKEKRKITENHNPLGDRDTRRPRRNQDDGTQKLNNPSMIDEWKLKANEDYSKFAGQHFELKPKIEERYCCARWHIRGYCFENCKNKVTHIPSQELNQASKTQFAVYVRTCRGE